MDKLAKIAGPLVVVSPGPEDSCCFLPLNAIDSANDEKLEISVIDNTIRNLSLTITKVSTGDTLVVGTIDQSGTGTIIYSDGRSAAITGWTLAD